jgi:hypothetical protein
LAVSDENREPVVVDWRAPVAEPFYRATGRETMGLARRRHFAVQGRELLGIEDELFGDLHLGVGHDEGLGGEQSLGAGLSGYSTLLSVLQRGRTGQLGDIVATIQSEQDEIIRSSSSGVLIVQGGPGTGKTTSARLLGELFKELGILSKGHFVEVGQQDLIAEYVGQTAKKTNDAIQKAKGGVLFIDEAYALNDRYGNQKGFGEEATDALVKEMEDRRESLVVILAGYKDPMMDYISINPGLKSRIPMIIEFPDYSREELVEIEIEEVLLGKIADIQARQFIHLLLALLLVLMRAALCELSVT